MPARRAARPLLASIAVAAVVGSAATAAAPPTAPVADAPADQAMLGAVGLAHWRLLDATTAFATRSYPAFLDGDGNWTTFGAGSWTSGFFPGSLWLSYEQTLDPAARTAAAAWTAGIEGQKANTSTHDLGFMVFDSFGNGYRLTGNDGYRQVVLAAARSLATRFNPAVGALRSWNSAAGDYQVIVDNMMNLELLLWAAAHGGEQRWRDVAVTHALTSARVFVRPDGSVVHLAHFDPATGALVSTTNSVVGLPDTATWSRGQAWAVHGFATVYRYTRDARLLAPARAVADYFLAHVPAGTVTSWRLDAPATASVPDSSATAIGAAGVLELAFVDPDPARRAAYAAAGRGLLATLTSADYLDTSASGAGVLRHATDHAQVADGDTSYADYYLLEAVERVRVLPTGLPALKVTAAVASSSLPSLTAAKAVDGAAASRWAASGSGQWLRLDLGATDRVQAVSVLWFAGMRRTTRFRIETSADGTRWVPATAGVSTGWTAGEETYRFRPRDARFVRITGYGNSTDATVSIGEVRVR